MMLLTHLTGHFDDFSSHHPTGTYFVIGDDSTRLVTNDVNEKIHQSLGTKNRGSKLVRD